LKKVYRAACLVLFALMGLSARAAEPAMASWPVVAAGVFAHDRGFASDNHEDGIDLNLEVQFSPLDYRGSPRPHLGTTLNFHGDTSVVYAGFDFTLFRVSDWFLDASISAAVHNGPLHKDPVGCREESDCGFGARVLPIFGGEIGYRLDRESAISLYYDHMSHKWLFGGENEGIDHIGVRYIRSF